MYPKNAYSNLGKYGLNDRFLQESTLYEGLFIARVSRQHRGLYKVIGERGELDAGVSGKLAYNTDERAGFPAVGDFVMIDRCDADRGNAIIHKILGRKSVFTRKAAGTGNDEQVIAANIDTVFICMSLNADFNLRRTERYLTIAWGSGAAPVIVLTKADLCSEGLEEKLSAISGLAEGVDVVVCSSENAGGWDAVKAYVKPGETIAFIGSSGVGKSTLINRLMGEDILVTGETRDDDKGRHTTTHRQLVLLPCGGIVIDTPGMRELQIYTGDLSKTFEDIERLASRCKFSDCSHNTEPGCAVQRAIRNGALSEERFENYRKLRREMLYEGLNSRRRENEKINQMFGGKAQMKQMRRRLRYP